MVGRFSLPPVLGKRTKAENRRLKSLRILLLCEKRVVFVYSAAIHICQKMYSPNNRRLAPKSWFFLGRRNWSLKNAVQMLICVKHPSSSAANHICRHICLASGTTEIRIFSAGGWGKRSRSQCLWKAIECGKWRSSQAYFAIAVLSAAIHIIAGQCVRWARVPRSVLTSAASAGGPLFMCILS